MTGKIQKFKVRETMIEELGLSAGRRPPKLLAPRREGVPRGHSSLVALFARRSVTRRTACPADYLAASPAGRREQPGAAGAGFFCSRTTDDRNAETDNRYNANNCLIEISL